MFFFDTILFNPFFTLKIRNLVLESILMSSESGYIFKFFKLWCVNVQNKIFISLKVLFLTLWISKYKYIDLLEFNTVSGINVYWRIFLYIISLPFFDILTVKIEWCQRDNFWWSNILSGKKFRKISAIKNENEK